MTDKLAAFKARDAQERIERAELDKATLDALIDAAEAAIAAVEQVEGLCGDLVSDVSHHALKAQATGGPSRSMKNILLIAQQSRAALDLFLQAEAAKAEG